MNIKNNETINLSDLNRYFLDYDVYLPLIQRNYKWPSVTPDNAAEIHSAQRFAKDLWQAFLRTNDINTSYTIGMITLYIEDLTNEIVRFQIVDGQQRMITLKLLLKALAPEDEYFPLTFERDEELPLEQSRNYFLSHHLEAQHPLPFENTDMQRFGENYRAIVCYLMQQPEFTQKKQAFQQFILHRVLILFHCTDIEPFDEFLNINKNKTRFSISDHMKAQLMIDYPKPEERIQILDVFSSLAKHLFNDELWEGVKLGYVAQDKGQQNIQLHYPDENRLKVLFVDRHQGNSKANYHKKKDLHYLFKYDTFLTQLSLDTVTYKKNQLNGYICFYYLNDAKIRYFKLLNSSENVFFFEEILMEQMQEMNSFKKNCFIESQLSGQTHFKDIVKSVKNLENSTTWIAMEDYLWGDFTNYYQTYIQEKYAKDED